MGCEDYTSQGLVIHLPGQKEIFPWHVQLGMIDAPYEHCKYSQ